VIYSRYFDPEKKKKLYKLLEDKTIISLLSTDENVDPNNNYNVLEDILITALNESIPLRKIKSNKYKYKRKDWIMCGLIKSIKYRDKLYKDMKSLSPESISCVHAKQNLKVYNRILKRSIREAKTLYYYRKFENSRSNSRETWNTINNVLHKKKGTQLPEYMKPV
jgi:hypothetical protein